MGLYGDRILPFLLNWQLARTPFPKEREKIQADITGVVLEVGFGSGLSLPYYPGGPRGVTRLLVLEPGGGMLRLARQRLASAPFPVDILPYDGSGPYPVADASVDWAVAELTLCSIPDVGGALREIRRTLKPGGRFRFMEHGAAEEPHILGWQKRLTPLQRRIGGGCHLDRDISALVGSAGFASVHVERVRLPHLPKLIGRLYEGTAVK